MSVKKEKSLSKVTLWQTGSKFLLEGLAFFTAPVFTRLLSPSDYGVTSVYSTWCSLISIVIGMQTAGSIALAKVRFVEEEFDKYLSSIITISFLSFALFFPLSIIYQKQIGLLLGFDGFLIPVMVLQSYSSFCVSFYSTKLIQQKRVELNALISLIVALSSVVLCIVLVMNFSEKKYIAKIIGAFIPNFIAGFIILFVTWFKGKCFFNKAYWSFCLRLTLPLILHGAGSLILSQSDRVMLKSLYNEAEAGIYSVTYSLALVISVIWSSFNTSWVPFYYEYKKKNDISQLVEKSKGYLITFSIITMGFILCAPEVFKIMAPPEYWSGLSIIPLVAMAYYLNFLYSFPVNYEFYHGETRLIAIGTIITALINIILNYILIPKYAGIGAAIATFAGFLFLMLFHFVLAKYVIKKDIFEYSCIFFLQGFISIFLVGVLYYFTMNLWYIRWPLAVALGVILLVRIIKKKSLY